MGWLLLKTGLPEKYERPVSTHVVSFTCLLFVNYLKLQEIKKEAL